MPEQPLSIAIVGAGYWGANLIRNFHGSNEWNVSHIVDTNTVALERFKKLYPTVESETAFECVLSDPSVDAIAVATPPGMHFAQVKRALEAGKHVLVEKPIAQNSREAAQLCILARERGLRLLVDHTFLFTGSAERLRDLRVSGELGEIYYIDSVRVNLGLFQESNVVWDLAPHDISIFNFILGEEPDAISLTTNGFVRRQTPEVGYLTLRYPGGCFAHAHVSWLSPVKVRLITISASRQMAVWNDVEPTEKIYLYDKGIVLDPNSSTHERQMVSYRLGDLHVPLVDQREALGKLAHEFAISIKNHTPTRCDGRHGASVVRAIEVAMRSAEQGGLLLPILSENEIVR